MAQLPSSGSPNGLIVGAVVFVVILLIVVIGIASLASYQPSSPSSPGSGGPSVDVTGVTVTSSDDACGLNGITYPAFASPNLPLGIGWGLPENGYPMPCTVESVTTDTPGFYVSANVPLTVTLSNTPLVISIGYPYSYSGPLHLIIQ